ncbi:SUMO-specific isopeptidase USPL1 isoform X2 [Polyodon spathula]|uniref:SUMO-specific isopeptidase USPL1 isoform X2 n=1 Tax=Polyodon spathula TaxID=7913 RepID=UPI001B7DAC88|nr:SUMO-specific isopeptidase USPL1 isoform X2 [Polyodon spathula]
MVVWLNDIWTQNEQRNLERFQLEAEDNCPLCAVKGRTQALQVYRINLQESIALCGNPQCIFPLGCKPLADVLISGSAKGKLAQSKAKRKHICTSPGNTQIDLPSKHRRSAEEINTEEKPKSVFETPVNGLACEPSAVSLGNRQLSGPCLLKENHHEVNGVVDSLKTNEDVAQKHNLNMTACILGKEEPPSVEDDLGELAEINQEEWVPVPRCLYWKNKHALCWLDCLMVALVQSRAVKECVINLNTESAIKRLCTVYEKACTLLTEQGKENEDGVIQALSGTVALAYSYLDDIRLSLFNLLQPKLRCTLGEQESPVFALPLFLKLDPQTEELFKHTYSWKFECSVCGYTSQDRCEKTLTTFTDIVPEWHPQNAVHRSPCNKCNRKLQRRRMVLERISSVFMLHFVEGLPHNDVNAYSFDFQGKLYKVSTVIQYSEDPKHFVSWISNTDGSWLECDDLKAPACCVHEQLEVSPCEIHIVFWETNGESTRKEPQTKDNFLEPVLKVPEKPEDSGAECNPHELSLPSQEAEIDITETPSVNTNINNSIENSCNSSYLQSAFEGLSPEDVITLTLVEVDPVGKLSDSSQITDPVKLSEQNKSPNGNQVLEDQSQVMAADDAYFDDTDSLLDNCSGGTLTAESVCTTRKASPKTLTAPSTPKTAVRRPSRSITNTAGSPKSPSPTPLASTPLLVGGKTTTPISSFSNGYAVSTAVNGNKSSGALWTSSLLKKHPSLAPLNALLSKHPLLPSTSQVHLNRNKDKRELQKVSAVVSDVQVPVKGADKFGGFRSKGLTKPGTDSANLTRAQDVNKGDSIKPAAEKLPCAEPVNLAISKNKGIPTSTATAAPPCNVYKLEPSKPAEKKTLALEGLEKTDKLRYKLLKKLKAKKEKLASLNRLLTTPQAVPDGRAGPLRTASDSTARFNKSSKMQRLDSTDSESVYTASASTSLCSSPSYDEFFADLLSPATTTGTASPDDANAVMLEALASEQNNGGLADGTSMDHNCYNFTPVVQPQAYTPKTRCAEESFFSPAKEDLFSELLSTSTLQSYGVESEDLHHFDENFF